MGPAVAEIDADRLMQRPTLGGHPSSARLTQPPLAGLIGTVGPCGRPAIFPPEPAFPRHYPYCPGMHLVADQSCCCPPLATPTEVLARAARNA